MKNNPVLVTGATGYMASWIIKYLLEEGYTVHATVRNLKDKAKYAHLTTLKNYGNLKLFEADLLRESSFKTAMEGCSIVIHTASPFLANGVKDPENQLIAPAVQGTINVLESANEITSVQRIVLTSSVVSVYGDAIEAQSHPNSTFNEKDWNKTSSVSHQPYSLSKTLAEKEAWRLANEQSRWKLTVINPGFIMGPSLSKRKDSTSIDFMLSMLNGKYASGLPDLYFGMVDVREVARAHILAGTEEQAEGRHILVADTISALDMAKILKKHYDDIYKIPTKTAPNFLLYLVGPFMGFSWKYLKRNLGIPFYFDNSYSKSNLGITYRPLEDTITDHAAQLIQDGLI